MDPVKVALHDKIAPVLDAARKHFVAGCKITLIVRLPGQEGLDLIISDDDIEEVEKLVKRKIAGKK
jgi:hypothetical protein